MAKYLISIEVIDLDADEPRHVTTRHDYIDPKIPNLDMLGITLKVADDVQTDLVDGCSHDSFDHGSCEVCGILEVDAHDWESLAEDRAWEEAK